MEIWGVIGIVTLLLVIVIIFASIYGKKKRNRLLDEGKIVNRKWDFYKDAEEFTIVCADTNLVTEAIKSIDYSEMKVKMQADSVNQVFQFEASSFASKSSFVAVLRKKEEKESEIIYYFSFSSIHTEGGLESPGTLVFNMNMLLTAIEKAFLKVDPKAQVKSYAILRKKKTV